MSNNVIDRAYEYKTRSGHEVRVHMTDAGGMFPVHGSWKDIDDLWYICSWSADGRQSNYQSRDHDLVKVAPRITRTLWINLYQRLGGTGAHDSKACADDRATNDRLACVKVEIDCEEGEGL